MIVRENETEFICITQNHHAHIAKQFMTHWFDELLHDDPLQEELLYAIQEHDVGWRNFDKEPLWNDKTDKPYTFIDLPLLIKTVLYTHGVTMVEKTNPYAAALCSAHYTKFLQKYEIKEVQQYVRSESIRRDSILQHFPEVDERTFNKHLSLLQFADNMSLYISLHEAGDNENKHRYFKKGVPIPSSIDKHKAEFIEANWLDKTSIFLKGLSEVEPFKISLQEKVVSKRSIQENGFLTSYKAAPLNKRDILFKS